MLEGGDQSFFRKAAVLKETSRKMKNTIIGKPNFGSRKSILGIGSIHSIKQGTSESLADIQDLELDLNELDDQD